MASQDLILRPGRRGLARTWLALGAAALLSGTALAAQDAAATEDDSLFGAETVTESKPDASPTPQNDFLKYEQVKVGGSLSGNLGWTATWADPWNKGIDPLAPDSKALAPGLQGIVKITAKPSADFGVNMDFRTSWPFFTTKDFLSSATYYADNPLTPLVVDPGVSTKTASITTTNINIFALYSKFSWNDAVYMSFGKQPLSWGVSKSFFQPADDIFALTAVDFADTGAEREGPIVFKAQVPLPLTMANAYFYAGVPNATSIGIEDMRIAVKGEASFGNTELAAGGFYAYNDHPRLLLMGTTGTGDFNFFGEAVGKWGSERYFLSGSGSTMTGAQKADQAWFSGTLGGYYTNTDYNIIVSAAYYYNGEGQGTDVHAQEAYGYYFYHQSQIDRMKFGTHYAAASFSWSKILVDNLSFMAYAVGDLSDLSFLVSPSFTWKFFDYASLKLGSTMTFGHDGTEYPTLLSIATGKPSVNFNATFVLGSGAF